MSRQIFTHVSVLGLALLVGGTALVSHARPTPDNPDAVPAGSLGVVDIERLYNASDAPQFLAQKAAAIEMEAQERLSVIAAARFLDVKELQEYGTLAGKIKPLPAEEARMKELKALSDSRFAELDVLNAKKEADVTAADKARMKALNTLSQQVEKILPGLQEDFRVEERDRIQAIRREQLGQLRVLIGQTAKEKGVAHVFDVNALVYSANDLTPAVLQKLAKRAGK